MDKEYLIYRGKGEVLVRKKDIKFERRTVTTWCQGKSDIGFVCCRKG